MSSPTSAALLCQMLCLVRLPMTSNFVSKEFLGPRMVRWCWSANVMGQPGVGVGVDGAVRSMDLTAF